MALFRPALALNRALSFYKLMGTGRNGTFDKHPNLQQYAIFSVANRQPPIDPNNYKAWQKAYYGDFINGYWTWGHAENTTFILEPILSHGSWDGKELFKGIKGNEPDGPIAVLTRATIRISRAREFWANVPPIQQRMQAAQGLQYSVGIGEMPYLRQATFSVWENAEAMKAFAYQMQEHREVINKTRSRQWYSEEMFTRFRVLHAFGIKLQ
jgi:hypothetical protein